MCGIAGFIDLSINYDAKEVAEKMGDAIYHRGPDSSGIWYDSQYGVHLIHRRLSIIDLSNAGHQPMISASGRYVIIFNGEIYNFKEVLEKIEDSIGEVILKGHSDTEIILWAIEAFGFECALELFEGMFGIALWDREKQRLFLARDRVGEKPLYYGYFNGVFGFSSELSALKCHPKFSVTINRNALSQMMMHSCIPAPISIYDGINKLPSGKYLSISISDVNLTTLPNLQSYWSLKDSISQRSFNQSFDEAVEELDVLLSKKVLDQMIADVPLGCFLSGGVDSSMIAALMQKQSSSRIKTFSIGFDNPEYNEAEYAKAVAKHIGSEHHELYVTEKDALNVVSKLPHIYSEPFSDSSQIPTFLVSQMAVNQVKVCLSGDGGDELFAGYNRYIHAVNLYNKISKLPKFIRKLGAKFFPLVNQKYLIKINDIIKLPITNIEDKIYRMETLLNAEEFVDFYLGLTTHWQNTNNLIIGIDSCKSLWDKGHNIAPNDQVLLMEYLDCMGYMSDDILVKVDRASMANSLETRSPLLNHKIIEFAFGLPLDYKINNGHSKYILRELLYKYVPRTLIERPKRGFSIPLNNWLRGELKEWACDLLNEHNIKNQGFFNYGLIKNKLDSHLNGTQNNGYLLWDVLMFQSWFNSN